MLIIGLLVPLLTILSVIRLEHTELWDRASDDSKEIDDAIREILSLIREWCGPEVKKDDTLPFVTLAFAQSSDGILAPYRSGNETASNFPVSGPESLRLTHALRSLHDGILVGRRTVEIDNPRLSNRLWTSDSNQPRPIVLDADLSSIRRGEMRMSRPIVCCRDGVEDTEGEVDLLVCRIDESGTLDLVDVLRKLKSEYGIHRVMVEGGPTVLDSFLRRGLVDCLCITVSPKTLKRGASLSVPFSPLPSRRIYRVGNDVCLLTRQ